ncbi:MAG: TonB-dependent siderophore receptor [Zoogloeaceae bacterium]|nr:TonB-dependent siderophore receptor [Zoogloeaceae bacterium]
MTDITPAAPAPAQGPLRPQLLPLGAMLLGFALPPLVPDAAAEDTTLSAVEVRETADNPRDQQTYQGGTTRVGKTEQLPKDVPQALTIVSEKLMFEKNNDTLKDALRNVAGLTFNAGEGGRIGDSMNLRGFYSFGDLYLDGIRDVAQYNREVFNLEQVDVLRGSAAMLFGRGQAGGVINQVTKQPVLVDRGSVTATVGTDNYFRSTADLNKKLSDTAAFRLNLMKTEADSTRDEVSTDRVGVAPTFRWGIGTPDEFSLGAYYLKTHNVLDYGVPFFENRPLDVDKSTFYGTSSDYEDNETTMLTGTWTHRFSSATTLRSVLRAADYQRDLWGVAPRLLAGATAATIADGTAALRRGRQARGGEEHTLTSQTDLTTHFALAGMKHEALMGLELLREQARRWSYNSIATAVAPNTTVGNPNPDDPLPATYGNTIKNAISHYRGYSHGLYAQDTVEFLPGWKFLLGARHDQMNASYSNGARVNYGEMSYRAGLSFQPSEMQHYYLAWSDSFNPTADLYQFTPTSGGLEPERSRTVELGAKWELFDGDLSLRTAVYRAQKEWERNTDVETATANALLSKRRHTNGFELEWAGRITPKWEVFGGWALMNAEIDEARPNGSKEVEGMRPRNTPPFAWNVWTTYKVAPAWKVGVGVDAKAARLAYGIPNGTATPNVNVAPGYRRLDAMIAYEQPRYTLKLNFQNLTDTTYYETVYDNGGHAIPGTGRAVQLTAEYRL